ncbi:helix-turn-helix domain-containing protein [Flagellimonas sp.]|uniref:helix-turn-helix domain-containing protein n=1 Tax=Flagellimonas sp. TaxID=2058762 RepID=UPI003F4A640D
MKDLLHLIPLGLVIYQYGPLYMLSRPDKIEVVTNREVMTIINPIPNFQLFLSVLMLLYGIAAYIKYAKNYKNDLDLKLWLKAISAFYLLFSLTNISYYILVYTSVLNPSLDYFITFSMVLFVSLFSYVGFMYPAIFEGNSFNHVVPFIKYKKTGLSPEFSKEMKDRLVVLMREEKPHLDPDIRLNILANLLDVSRHHASQIINEHFSMNFFDFINYHRIIEAEKLLKSKKESHLSITDIAFQSGFNNRISFYKAFKKNMGTSPSEYRALNPSS